MALWLPAFPFNKRYSGNHPQWLVESGRLGGFNTVDCGIRYEK